MMTLLPVAVSATVINGTCGENVTWSLNTDSKTLTISGSGPMRDVLWRGAPWYPQQENIEHVYIADGVTTIGDYIFYECEHMKDIRIPTSITNIGEGAFGGCHNLETPIAIPEGQKVLERDMFSECYKLPQVIIPEGVERIYLGVFWKCGMQSLHIPASVVELRNSAVGYNTNLTSITVAEGNELLAAPDGCNALISKQRLYGEYWDNTVLAIAKNGRIPSDRTYQAGQYLFAGRTDLTTFVVPDNLAVGGSWGMFADCTNLTTLAFTSYGFGHEALRNCSSLRDLYMYYDNSISFGGDHCLDNVPVNEVTLHVQPQMVEYYEEHYGTDYFKAIVPLADLTEPQLIDGVYYMLDADAKTATVVACPEGKDKYTGTITIPARVSLEFKTYDVVGIEPKAFAGCTALTAINVASTNTRLTSPEGSNAIVEKATNTLVAGIATSTIPASVTAIGEGAFYRCTGLTTLTLHKDIASIGKDAFAGCTGLTAIECYAETVPTIGEGAFEGVTAKLTVPKAAVEAYQTALAAFTGLQVINFPEKIKTPTISYVGGKLKFLCETEGVTFHYTVTSAASTQESTGDLVELKPVYQVVVYATKENWIDSDTATFELNAVGQNGDMNGDGVVDIADAVKIVNMVVGKE